MEELLKSVSDRYEGENRLWLRLLLNDHCSGQVLSKEDVPALEWFNELESKGCIQYNPTDVEILLDIARVTNKQKAIDLIEQFKVKHPNNNEEYNFTKGEPITEYRKRLFTALRENTRKVSTMQSQYSEGNFTFSNIWDFVFNLEREELLVDEEKSIGRFAKVLDKNASNILLGIETKRSKRRPSPIADGASGERKKLRIKSDGIDASTPEKNPNELHGDLLDDISRELTSDDVKKYKTRLKDFGGFGAREVEDFADDIEKVFSAQQKRKIFSVGQYGKLKEQLKKVRRYDLVTKVTKVEMEMENIGFPV